MKAKLDHRLLLILCVLLLATAACAIPAEISGLIGQFSPTSPVIPTIDLTGGQPTVVGAEVITSTAPAQPTFTNTPFPTLRPSSTPYPTPTYARVSVNQTVCDSSAFVKDVTIPDGTTVSAGTLFFKTWRLRNTGRCKWTEEYSIDTTKGELMGFNQAGLDQIAMPGDEIDVTVELTAPTKPGSYRTYFQLRNKRGTNFGTKFYVDIKVTAPPEPTPTNSPDLNVKYEFANRYCDATWSGSGVALDCKATSGSNGYVQYIANPVLETGYVDNEPGLLMVPPSSNDSFITAIYPAYPVQAGDHLATIIGCGRDATSCNIRFDISYTVGGGTVQLFAWNDAYDNLYKNVDLDLTSLAGQNVSFIFTVYSMGPSSGDKALWLRPRILRP